MQRSVAAARVGPLSAQDKQNKPNLYRFAEGLGFAGIGIERVFQV